MPWMEFKCKCGKSFDKVIFDLGVVEYECPNCGKKAKKLEIPSSFGMQFKGKGFYSTDNKKGISE